MNQQDTINFLIRALEFFKLPKNKNETVYYDIPREVIDIFIFKTVGTFPRYINWKDNDKIFQQIKGWDKERLDFKLEVLRDVLKETIHQTVVVLDNPNIEKAINVATEHEKEVKVISDSGKEVPPDPNVTILTEALVEPENLQRAILDQIPENVTNRDEIASFYIKGIASVGLGEEIPVFDLDEINSQIAYSRNIFNTPSFWTSPISIPAKLYAEVGLKKLGELSQTNAADVAAIHLATRYGRTKMNFSEFKARALGTGKVSMEQFNLIESAFRTIEPDDPSWWMKAAMGGKIAQLDDRTTIALFAGETINPDAIAPQSSFIGNFFKRGIQQFTGNSSLNFVDQSIRSHVINVTKESVVKKITKSGIGIATSQLVSGVTSVLVASSELLSNAIPILGPILVFLATKILRWITTKIGLWIRKHLGAILGIFGFFAGASVFGAIGGVIIGIGGLALGGAITGVGAGAAIFGFFATLFGITMTAILTPLLITFIGIPIAIALILFIINAGAYVVPPAGNGILNPPTPITAGPGCPSGWPATTKNNELYEVRQGPGGPVSHGNGDPAWNLPPIRNPQGQIIPYLEAIDVAPVNIPGNNGLVTITHPGTVMVAGLDFNGGSFVEVQGLCNGILFRSLYVHMRNIEVEVGQKVDLGTIVGQIGMTGWAGGIHVHYEFLNDIPGRFNGTPKSDPYRKIYPPPFMIAPFIPKTVPQFCLQDNGAKIVCNVNIP